MPHGFCLQWNPQLVGLLVVSNLLTALSYYSIPANLLYIAARKKVRFGWILVLFATFIVLVTIWNGNYWLEAVINALTAGISLITAVALWILIPQVFAALDTDVGRRVIRTEKTTARTQMIASLVLGMLAIVFVGGLLYQQSLGLIDARMQFQQFQDQVEVKLKALDSASSTHGSVSEHKEAHSVIQKVLDLEDRFMKSNNDELNTRTRWYLLTFVLLAILAIGLFCSFGYFMSKYLVDISAANKAVRESEELLRLTLASVKDFAIINLDPAGKIIAWNSAAQDLHGYEENEIIGKHFSALYDNDTSKNNATEESRSLQQSLALVTSEGGFETERWQIRKDQSKFWADVALSPIYDEHKNPTGFVQITRDVTERRRAQDEIKEQAEQLRELTQKLVTSNQDLQQFAYLASHDLQEPLRTITSFCELLEKKTRGNLDADSRKYLSVIVEGTSRMRRLIKDLLQCAKIDTQGKPLVPTELKEVLEQSLDGLKFAINESHAEITYDVMPLVLGDESQLSLLFQNLVGNAIKFRGDRVPKIHITSEFVDGNWRISVRDNGIGINEEYSDRIFVIFQRLHARSKFEGSGIGLAVCKRIVERHGGTISVNSVPDEGSTFVFTLQGGN
jgi:PAS domain S-box-containing protein